MENLRFLRSKEIKQIRELLKEQWEYEGELDYALLMSASGDIFVLNRDIGNLEFEKLRVNSAGLYFAELRNDELRLSIEGSQIIGPKAKKNIIDISSEQLSDYLKGADIDTEANERGFMILRNNADFFGCSKIKNSRLLNFYPKSRRINTF